MSNLTFAGPNINIHKDKSVCGDTDGWVERERVRPT